MPQFVYNCLIEYWKRNTQIIEYFLTDYIIDVLWQRDELFRSELEAIPFNQPNLYFFQHDNCMLTYDRDKWNSIKEDTTFFKTSWKLRMQDEVDGKTTFMGALLNGIIVDTD